MSVLSGAGGVGAGRRLLGIEVSLVLALTLGQSAIYAVLRIIDRMTVGVPLAHQTSSLNTSQVPDRPWLDLLYQLARVAFLPMGGLLAVYLLATVLSPRGGVRRALGLDLRGWRADLGWTGAFLVVIGVPGLAIYLIARQLRVNTVVQASGLGEHWWSIPILVLSAIGNGALEELVMIGYLLTRGSQIFGAEADEVRPRPWLAPGRVWWCLIVASALIRGAYHLYQGFGGMVGNTLMGIIFGLFFVRTRRVLPLVAVHALIDIVAFVGYALLAGRVGWL